MKNHLSIFFKFTPHFQKYYCSNFKLDFFPNILLFYIYNTNFKNIQICSKFNLYSFENFLLLIQISMKNHSLIFLKFTPHFQKYCSNFKLDLDFFPNIILSKDFILI